VPEKSSVTVANIGINSVTLNITNPAGKTLKAYKNGTVVRTVSLTASNTTFVVDELLSGQLYTFQIFASKAGLQLSASQARNILGDMGLNLPSIISTKESLANFLRSTPRLNSQQIQEFYEAVKNLTGG
jgi:hypothetical protein